MCEKNLFEAIQDEPINYAQWEQMENGEKYSGKKHKPTLVVMKQAQDHHKVMNIEIVDFNWNVGSKIDRLHNKEKCLAEVQSGILNVIP